MARVLWRAEVLAREGAVVAKECRRAEVHSAAAVKRAATSGGCSGEVAAVDSAVGNLEQRPEVDSESTAASWGPASR
jgi:hypothetical protein